MNNLFLRKNRTELSYVFNPRKCTLRRLCIHRRGGRDICENFAAFAKKYSNLNEHDV
jgi:hypothetical protein